MKLGNIFYISCVGAVAFLVAIDLFTDINSNSTNVDSSGSTQVPAKQSSATPKLASGAVPNFKAIPAGSQRKQAFFSYFLPLIEQRNQELTELRAQITDLYHNRTNLSSTQQQKVIKVANDFDIEGFSLTNDNHWATLLRRVDIVPPSLALAQAANESAWGTSRFALKGNNYFGQWCFKKGCGLVPKSRGAGLKHEVAKFNSPRQSVNKYMHNLNTHDAYFQLRLIREKLRGNEQVVSGLKLSAGLLKYSERGAHYVKELNQMIRFNKLDKLDS